MPCSSVAGSSLVLLGFGGNIRAIAVQLECQSSSGNSPLAQKRGGPRLHGRVWLIFSSAFGNRESAMNSPFPGMDPYLETPALWSDFNASFITYWRDALIDCLPSNYEARIIEEETHERRIEILHRPDRTLV